MSGVSGVLQGCLIGFQGKSRGVSGRFLGIQRSQDSLGGFRRILVDLREFREDFGRFGEVHGRFRGILGGLGKLDTTQGDSGSLRAFRGVSELSVLLQCCI